MSWLSETTVPKATAQKSGYMLLSVNMQGLLPEGFNKINLQNTPTPILLMQSSTCCGSN